MTPKSRRPLSIAAGRGVLGSTPTTFNAQGGIDIKIVESGRPRTSGVRDGSGIPRRLRRRTWPRPLSRIDAIANRYWPDACQPMQTAAQEMFGKALARTGGPFLGSLLRL